MKFMQATSILLLIALGSWILTPSHTRLTQLLRIQYTSNMKFSTSDYYVQKVNVCVPEETKYIWDNLDYLFLKIAISVAIYMFNLPGGCI